jgi:Holliday junction resolvase
VTNYRHGSEFERRVRKDLADNGYDLVIKSAGSKTVVDLAAFKPGQALFIQAKRDGKISPAERTELLRVSAHIDALPIVAWKVPGKAAIRYWLLSGPGPQERSEWLVDEVSA